MKALLLSIAFFTLSFVYLPNNRIFGNWKVLKFVRPDTTIYPLNRDYFVAISKAAIKFNLEVNDCSAGIVTIDDSTIQCEKPVCAELCCDGRHDTLSNYIDYNGHYKFRDSVLMITNTKGILFLLWVQKKDENSF